MPTWNIATVDQRPHVTLTGWAMFEVPLDGAGEPWTRHLVGYALEDRQGQVSSAVQTFDPARGQCVTRSGRVYQLRGRPGIGWDADYVWQQWKARAGLSDQRDVTGEIERAMDDKFRSGLGFWT